MFDSLRKKLSGWLGVGKKEEEEKKPKKEIGKEKKIERTGKIKEEKKEAGERVIAGKKTEKKEGVKKKAEKEKSVSDKSESKKKGEIKAEGEEVGGKVQEKEVEKEDKEIIDVEIREEINVEDVEKEEENGEKEEGWLKKWWKKKEEIKEREEELEEKKEEREVERERNEKKDEKVEVEIKKEVEIQDRVEKKGKKEEKETEETPKEGLKKEIEEEGGFFAKLKKKLTNSFLKKEEFEEIFPELEFTLLENNVALGVVDKIKDSLSKDLVGINIKKADVEKKIVESLKSAILKVLVEGEDLIGKIKKSRESPFVILFFGINGSGKTTSLAKIAYKLKKEGISCVLVAGDTFRAASIEQLEKHAEKIGEPIIKGEYGKDPASVGFDAVQYAKKNKIKVVLVDTAGRMYTKSNLMKEMEKIVKVTKPNLKIFVGESITGNDATEQAKMFNETAGIDGIILTKADVDEKAGAILSVGFVTGKPIFYLGVGQNLDDLKEFKKIDVLKGLGLG